MTLLILGIILLTKISTKSVSVICLKINTKSNSIKIEITEIDFVDKILNSNLPDQNGDNIISSSTTIGKHRLTLGPPWNTDVNEKKEIWSIGDAWHGGTEINEKFGKTTLHS